MTIKTRRAAAADPQVSENESEPEPASETTNSPTRQSRNASSGKWRPWQDRFLASECHSLRPFSASRSDAWDALAKQMLEDSTLRGPQSIINRSGSACRSRMKKLIDMHKKNETLSLQATGTNEEVNEHIETMTALLALYDAEDDEITEKSASAKRKKDLEEQAGKELRESSMRSLIPRKNLTDISVIEGASVREKQGQRNEKRYRSPSLSEKENPTAPVPSRKKARRADVRMIATM